MRGKHHVLAVWLLTACGVGRPAPAPQPSATAQWWITTPDRQHLLERQPDRPIRDLSATEFGDSAQSKDDGAGAGAGAGAVRITIDTAARFQSMVGFGAALTDASAELLQRLRAGARDTLLRELFGRAGNGVGFSTARLTIGASDFSRNFFTFADAPAGVRDTALRSFSIDSARTSMLPVLRRAIAINPQLFVMATPWSAPAWMKSSGSLIGGTLDTAAYPAFAEYLRRTIEAFGREGVPVSALSVQNEPHHLPPDYPGMRFLPAQRAAFIGRHLGPLFAARGVRTQILDWDHNWDEPESPLAVLRDSAARRFVRGVAWHCYAGDVRAQSAVHDAFPDVDTYFTECAGGEWAPDFGANLRWNVRTLIIGATRHWARGVTLWNLALDEQHGPHTGGCTNCRGVLTIDSRTGVVTRNEEFYALAHASRFVRPGAVRIGAASSNDSIAVVAFRHPDDQAGTLIAVNDTPAIRTVQVHIGRRTFALPVPAGGVATATWR